MQRIERFCKTTRWFHWTFVLPFLGLAGSGLALALREWLGLDGGDHARAGASPRRHRTVLAARAAAGAALRAIRERALADLREPLRIANERPALARAPAARAARPRGAPARRQAERRAEAERAARRPALALGLALTGVWLWLRPGALVPWLAAPRALRRLAPGLRRSLLPRRAEPGHAPALRAMLDGRRRPRLGAAPPPALGGGGARRARIAPQPRRIRREPPARDGDPGG